MNKHNAADYLPFVQALAAPDSTLHYFNSIEEVIKMELRKKMLWFNVFCIAIIIAGMFLASTYAEAKGYRNCAKWDTFCKNPAQIVATKCRLQVPVKREQCEALGISFSYLTGSSLEEGLPVTSMELNKDTIQILKDEGWL